MMSYVNCIRSPENVEMLARILQRRNKIDGKAWWPNRYEEGKHFATESEVREYLALCSELGESFTTDHYMAVSTLVDYPLGSVHYVADLLEKAGWPPSGTDQSRMYAPEKYLTEIEASELEPENILVTAVSEAARLDLMKRYTERHEKVAAYFGGFLKDAPRITAASELIGKMLWFWEELVLMRRWDYRAVRKRLERDDIGWLHWKKWKRLGKQAESDEREAEFHRKLKEAALERLQEGLRYCYDIYSHGKDVGRVICPVEVNFYPTDVPDLIPTIDLEEEVGVLVEWDDFELTQCLGAKKLERALELHRYVMTWLQLQIPGKGYLDLAGIEENYPEVPESLYPYCLSGNCSEKKGGMMSVVREAQRRKIRSEEGLEV